MLNSAQSLARSRSVSIHQFVSIRYRSKVAPSRAENPLIPPDRRETVHRHSSARFAPGYCVSSLPCDVNISLEADEATSAGVRFIRWLFPDGNPRHPNAASLPGPAFLVQCQEPAKNLLWFHSASPDNPSHVPLPSSLALPAQHTPPRQPPPKK